MDEGFHTTRWTRVMAARGSEPEARVALAELCEIYYGPVSRFIRHAVGGGEDDSAEDLAHAFFESLLGGAGIRGVEPGRAKFRSYLLGAVKHFLADRRKWDQAEKRGGEGSVQGRGSSVSLEGSEVGPVSDAYFDREWAMALLARSLDRVAEEHALAGKGALFEKLKPWLNGNDPGVLQSGVAGELGIGEGAVKVAIHRLRKRLRAIVRAEIGQTVETEEEIGPELNYLIEALA